MVRWQRAELWMGINLDKDVPSATFFMQLPADSDFGNVFSVFVFEYVEILCLL